MQDVGGIIVGLLNQVDTISEHFVLNGYQRLVNTYAPVIYSLVTLSVITYGYAALQGWVSLSLAETSKRLLTVGFVLSFALNWGTFSQYIYDLCTNTPNEIAGILIKSIPHSNYGDASGVNSALQQAWYDGMGFVVALWERGGWNNIFPYLWASVVGLLIILLVGVALIELIVAKFGLAIFLVIAPLAIPTLLFKPTKEILFDGWLKHVVGFALIPIFVTSALALGLSLLADSVGSIQQAIREDTVTIINTSPYVIYLIVSIGLVFKATHMAANMASGFSLAMSPHFAQAAQSFGRFLKGMVPKSLPSSRSNSIHSGNSPRPTNP